MGETVAKAARKPRADSIRNRERVLEAARAVFSAGGPDASLEGVARRADVGIGTLYRHFPTKEALFEAVYRREVEQLADLATALQRDANPVKALRCWMHANVGFVATKKGMMAALAIAAYGPSDLTATTFAQLTQAAADLLHRGVAAGLIRDDIGPEDLLRALFGLCSTHTMPGTMPSWQINVARLVDVFVDGLGVAPHRTPAR